MASTVYRKAKQTKPCRAFPQVWAAIVGCTGRGNLFRHTTEYYGSRRPQAAVEFACPTCAAAKQRLDALPEPAHQDELRRLQDAAGVRDYRIAEVVMRDGRPVLTGRIDEGAALTEAIEAVHEWAAGGCSVDRAARAILVYGRDCRELVRGARVTAQQREQLAAAYRRIRDAESK